MTKIDQVGSSSRRWRRLLFLISGVVLALPALALITACGARPAQGEAQLPGPAASLAYDAGTDTLWASANEGIYRRSEGMGWQAVSAADQASASQPRLTTDPHRPDTVYQTGAGLGVMRSSDGGETWEQIGDGLPSKDVGAFAVNSVEEGTLYAWIEGQGVFRTRGGGPWERMDDGPSAPVTDLVHSPLEGSMNTGWLYALTPEGVYLSMDCF